MYVHLTIFYVYLSCLSIYSLIYPLYLSMYSLIYPSAYISGMSIYPFISALTYLSIHLYMYLLICPSILLLSIMSIYHVYISIYLSVDVIMHPCVTYLQSSIPLSSLLTALIYLNFSSIGCGCGGFEESHGDYTGSS